MNKKIQLLALGTVMLVSSVFMTGCGSSKNELMDYRVKASGTVIQSSDDTTQDYLSKDLCVIPKKGQTKKQDAVMTADASLMVNDTDGKMLYSHNIYKKLYPASITKIVTAYVALKYGNLKDTVTISHNAANITEYGAKLCGFKEGDRIVLKDLLYSFLIYSGNDAGVAIAEHIAGDTKSFATMMNREMKNLGAKHTHFVNPHGLHNDKHYTTAYDLYLVFHHLAKNRTFMDIISRSNYTAKFVDATGKSKSLYFTSTDRYLLGTAKAPTGITVIGGKTGTTNNAGSCLILYSKGKKNKNYISVVLKAAGPYALYGQMNHLLDYGTK